MKKKLQLLIVSWLIVLPWLASAQTTVYNLGDQSTFTNTGVQWAPVTSTTSPDGRLRTQAATSPWHSAGYGIAFKQGNILEIDVLSGNSTIRFYGSVHSSGTMTGSTTLTGNDLGSKNVDMDAYSMPDQTGCYEFNYVGGARTLYFTFNGSNAYTPSIAVNLIPMTFANTDVWDFGATQLSTSLYNNKLNEAAINAWYPGSVTPGTTGVTLPASWTAGDLSWTGASNDRLRTSNTSLSRFDTNIASVTTHTGRVYCNGNAAVTAGLPTSRFLSITLQEDDEVKIIARGDTDGTLKFLYSANPASQTDTGATTSASGAVSELNFVAKQAGTYYLFDQSSKVSFYRIYRKAATYVNVTGTVDVSLAAGIPAGYSLVFTNAAGKSWTAAVNSGTYSVNIPVGYSYELSLANASGYIITTGEILNTTGITTPATTHNVVVLGVSLYTVSGNITGLDTATIANLALTYTAAASSNSVYVPVPVINTSNATYTVQLEAGIEYTITAQGVNDYQIPANTITIPAANTTAAIAFTPKPLYGVTVSTAGLTATQSADLQLTFTNLNETGYVYNFNNLNTIALRNGTYKVSFSGLDNYPVELALTSNLVVNNAATSKTLTFKPVTVWSFNDQTINTSTTASYKGMLFTGQITTVPASGHLAGKTGATIKVPVHAGEKVTVFYYYTANFSIEGGAEISTATNSTSIVENAEYVYTGTADGFVTLTFGGPSTLTSYLTEVRISPVVAYSPVITVGTDKQYQTINAALDAISNMARNATDRVTVMIDPGNYEEMLVVNQANVTLKNASSTPSTAIMNKGVDISPNAVRITSYYGHGYHYYSMGNDQKWHADVLAVNQANGSVSYQNAGAGTTNGSYWNATVVVSAAGFVADNIIFENSFNQYISAKEAQDVVQMWANGSPGARPTTVGDVTVQNRTMVERAAALAIANNTDKVILNKCRVIGRQDSFYGGAGARVAIYKGDYMGAVDYIFGGMDVVFYKSNLAMNVSDQSNDQAYITAAQQSSGRGYLMYECRITTAIPQVETASTYRAKPGYFGRPWSANTSEVVFYNTTIETSDYPGSIGASLIMPLGWQSTLGGTSAGMYEFGTTEASGVNNGPSRASWATMLTTPTLTDGTAISTFNFTKGSDNWDPFPQLIADDVLGNGVFQPVTAVNVIAYKNVIKLSNVTSQTEVHIYGLNGTLIKTVIADADTHFTMPAGIWIAVVKARDGQKSVKLATY
ncbi:MAG: pectinesterase family protein [Flavobacterium sp.]